MNLILRILFLGLLLGPQFGTMLASPEPSCEDARNCCTPSGDCDANCAHCACCVSPTPSLTSAPNAEPLDTPPVQTTIAAAVAPLPPLPTDILHVPKAA